MKIYFLLGGIFLLSVLGASFLPLDQLFKGIFAMPAVLAMIGGLFQIVRDNAAHERTLQLQRKEQIFVLGATSHMANVAFDKHAEFCVYEGGPQHRIHSVPERTYAGGLRACG